MKRIKVNAFREANKTSLLTMDRRHKIVLGNSICCYFTNKYEAKKYLHLTNVFLNIKVQELNKIYTDVYSEHRKIYLICYNYMFKIDVLDNIKLIEKAFNMILDRCDWANGSYFTWKWFFTIIEQINLIIDNTVKTLKDNNDYRYTNNLLLYKEHLQYIHDKLSLWGSELQANTPNVFYKKSIN